MDTLDIKNKDSLKNATRILKNGGILVFPTDTVYGIGCLLNEKAIKRLYQIKERPLTQPTAVLMNSKDIPLLLQKEYKKYPPGQVTIITYQNNYKIKFPKILLKDDKIGIRVPDDPWLQALLKITGPIVASSANRKGERTPIKFSELDLKLLEKVDLVIKTNKVSINLPSTIYDLKEDKIIRN